MRCPFPGMDPYLERREIWPDFHDRLITFICSQLQPLLRPRYAAITQDRLYVVESERPIKPDVSVIERGLRVRSPRSMVGGTAVADPEIIETEQPAVIIELRVEAEEFREPLIHIIEPAAGNRLVTAIEVLSPDNKRPGPGRVSYQQKLDEYRHGGANIIEIDLLRTGETTARAPRETLEKLRPWTYMVLVTRVSPLHQEVYPIQIRNRLPRVPVPLSDGDHDIVLDLQSAFERCWDEGPYPELLHYGASPPGHLDEPDAAWSIAIAKSSQ